MWRWHVTFCLLTVTWALSSGEGHGQCCRKLRTEMRRKMEKLCSRKRECPVGYLRFKGVCYWFKLGDSNIPDWWGAQNWCRDHGGNLVTVNDHRRETFIREHLEANFHQTGNEIKINTGLIFTDSRAIYPHVQHSPRNNPTSQFGDGLRWTNTRELVLWKQKSVASAEKVAKWSPTVEGDYDGPSKHLFLSCVVIIWNPDISSALTWRFNDCHESGLHVICEVRLHPPPSPTPPHTRNKRSPNVSYNDVLLGVHKL